jgi:hypothetical protein
MRVPEPKRQLEECVWKMRFYDERKNDLNVSESQREIAEKWYKVYRNLCIKMYKQLEKERGEMNE